MPMRLQFLPSIVAAAIVLSFLNGCAQLDTLRPTTVDPGVRAGMSLLQRDRQKAIGQFDATVHTGPPSFRIYSSIAAGCMKSGHYDLAAKYALQGAEALPKDTADDRKDKAMLF